MPPVPPPSPADPSDHAAARLDKLRQLEALGVDPWGGRFDGRAPIGDVRRLPAAPFDDSNPGPRVRIAGRVVARRLQGKILFLDLWDQTGKVQVMAGQKQVGDHGWQVLDLVDLGDLVGVDGEFGLTRKGEPTVRAAGVTYLTKSLEPHPSNYYGMGDVEYRLRHRYLDLIYTPDTLRRARQRVHVVRTIRRHLDAQGYLEVETPTLHAVAGGAAARPFVTHHNALDIDLYLRIALELPLKKLLVGGLDKVYEIGRVFRNEGISPRHNPEFTMLELYQAYGDLFTMMDLTEGLIVACVDAVRDADPPLHNESRAVQEPPARALTYGDKVVDFTPPFKRARYADLFRGHVGCDMFDREAVRAKAAAAGIPVEAGDPPAPREHDVVVQDLFERHVEDALAGPVFVYDYPAAVCPLTKRKRDNPLLAERFELYVHGMELANAYTELNDPITQEETFRRQLAGLPEEESMAKMDADFVRALRHGMPPAGGLGVGIDRLVMLLTDTPTIRDVILFPLLRPEASSVIRRYRYDPDARTLAIEFTSGAVYEYRDVPEREKLELDAATSQGGYFNAHIRDKYPARKVL